MVARLKVHRLFLLRRTASFWRVKLFAQQILYVDRCRHHLVLAEVVLMQERFCLCDCESKTLPFARLDNSALKRVIFLRHGAIRLDKPSSARIKLAFLLGQRADLACIFLKETGPDEGLLRSCIPRIRCLQLILKLLLLRAC